MVKKLELQVPLYLVNKLRHILQTDDLNYIKKRMIEIIENYCKNH